MTSGDPISYQALKRGVAVLTADGHQFGKVDHVLADDTEDLFDGIVVATDHGVRLVDADQVGEITTERVTCTFDLSGVDQLQKPDGAPVYSVDILRAEGKDLHDRVRRMFGGSDWRRKKSDD
ncbi:MAG: hypothetical protein ACJ735_09645 [Actinomycetes bacterium]